MITKGINYLLVEIDESKQLERLQANIEWGNYLVRDQNAELKVKEFINNELDYSYLIPILRNLVIEIPSTKAYPIYIITQ